MGWRLPSVVELRSVQDPTLPAPFVPAIFTGVQSAFYWSATTNVLDPTLAWIVGFGLPSDGGLDVTTNTKASNGLDHVWCVRGPMNADAY